MDADAERSALDTITSRVIGCAHTVGNVLGPGFLEKVYENALMVELRYDGLRVDQQVPFQVRYREEVVGNYIPDIVVEHAVILEVKAQARLDVVNRVQCLNYLRATGLRIALLLNFGSPRVEVQRVVHRY
ncbi:MAG TPA: GxxExxY protein [Usitatibacter sp.]|nr:GxxExxY protein [Usitatibacter sp.]